MNTKTRVHIYFNEEFELLHKYFIANDSYEFLPFESINKVDPNDFIIVDSHLREPLHMCLGFNWLYDLRDYQNDKLNGQLSSVIYLGWYPPSIAEDFFITNSHCCKSFQNAGLFSYFQLPIDLRKLDKQIIKMKRLKINANEL
jgi:hypothetical protein